ncbi:hypothetical protein Btru_065623 [Bulinus truncatus]|nr:hypothetical protein Btru_065623 [Bulinus truncatus]
MTSTVINQVHIYGHDMTNYSINLSANSNIAGDDRNANDGSSSNELPSATALHIGAIVMLIALLWGLFGNILTSFVILTNRDLKNTTNVFIVSLCINDILNLGINNMIVLISYFMMEWRMGLEICEMVMHFTVLLMGSSLWHTGLISIHRLIVVCFNNFYKKISKKAYTIFVLSFARIVPLLFMITPHLGNMSQFTPKLIRCIARKEFLLYTMLVSVTLQMLPSIILIVCYIAIFVKVFRSSSAIRATRKREWLRREIQVTKMFGMVFLLIILGYLPYGIVRFIDRKLELSADFYVGISVVYAVANSCNPIIYGVMDRKIRRYCFRALGLEETCMRKNNVTSPYLVPNGGSRHLVTEDEEHPTEVCFPTIDNHNPSFYELSEKSAVVVSESVAKDFTELSMTKSQSSNSAIAALTTQFNKSRLRKSEEDLVSQRCAVHKSSPKSGKSDSLADLLNGTLIGGDFCFANACLLYGGWTSTPTLNKLPHSASASDSSGSRKLDSRAKCKVTPRIVIDRPSDDEEELTSDDVDVDELEEYYSRQLVLSEWEEICRDLRVTEL